MKSQEKQPFWVTETILLKSEEADAEARETDLNSQEKSLLLRVQEETSNWTKYDFEETINLLKLRIEDLVERIGFLEVKHQLYEEDAEKNALIFDS